MLHLSTKTVGEIALEIPMTTRVFENFHIDYCCGGKKMFLEACRAANANPEDVVQEIESVVASPELKEFDWLKTSSLTDLITYILEKHHVFTKDEVVNLTTLLTKVVNRHGEKHLELFALERTFNELCNDLLQHLLKEEQVLFPYIESLEKSLEKQTAIPISCFGTVRNPVKMMVMEHDMAGEFLQKMREITNNYMPPEGVCVSFTTLYARLQAFEADLHQHIHLENNLLFPKAVALEERIFGE